jgi:hypothetical protein
VTLARAISLGALLLAACTSVRVSDVERAFADEAGRLVPRLPATDDASPARAAEPRGAMRETERLARSYIERRGGEGIAGRYVTAMLACSLLAQDRAADARAVVLKMRARREEEIARRNVVADAAQHAVGACRALGARRALEEVFAGERPPIEFLKEYGSFIAVRLPPGNEAVLRYEAEKLRITCIEGAGVDPGALRELNRRRLRHRVAGTAYDEMVSLLVTLEPPPPERAGEVERWLATVGLGLLVVYGQTLLPDLLPERMNAEARAWEREQFTAAFDHGRKVAAYLLPGEELAAIRPGGAPGEIRTRDDAYRALYAAMLTAEVAAGGWVQRG